MNSVWPQAAQPGPQNAQPIIFQPTTNNTTIIMQQPGAVSSRKRPWHSGTFGCMDDICSCLLVSFLWPLCLLEWFGCYLSIRMKENCLLFLCVPGYLTALRTKLRTAQNIEGGICNDCVLTICCRPCVMCQMFRELDHCDP